MQGEFWFPLVDEPIGEIVTRIEEGDSAIRALVDSPQKLLAFRTFSYIKVGIVLGELLVDRDDAVVAEGKTWVDQLAADPEIWRQLALVVRQVAEEIGAETTAKPDQPDGAARERFRAVAKRVLQDE